MNNSEEISDSWVREPVTRDQLFRRSPALIVMVYYVLALIGAWSVSGYWGWSFERGLEWSSGGPGTILPFPSYPGALMMITPALLHDQIFYLFFIHGTNWIWWNFIGFLYVFSPYRIERSFFCSLMKKAIIVQMVVFLLGAILVTNMHPRTLQVAVYGVAFLLFLTVTSWLVACRRRYAGLRVIG
jgi:hypothetical protein